MRGRAIVCDVLVLKCSPGYVLQRQAKATQLLCAGASQAGQRSNPHCFLLTLMIQVCPCFLASIPKFSALLNLRTLPWGAFCHEKLELLCLMTPMGSPRSDQGCKEGRTALIETPTTPKCMVAYLIMVGRQALQYSSIILSSCKEPG